MHSKIVNELKLNKKEQKKLNTKNKILNKYGSLSLTKFEMFVFDSNLIHNNKYEYKIEPKNFSIVNSIVTIYCKIHGDFDQSPNSHKSGSGCPKCGKLKSGNRLKVEIKYNNFIKNANIKHNNYYIYDKVDINQFNVSNYLNQYIQIKCPKHGYFKQKIRKHLSGNKCKSCVSESYLLSNDEIIRRFKLVHGNKYDYSKVNYSGYFEKIEIICPIHNSFFTTPRCHLKNTGCYLCHKHKYANQSKPESFWLDCLKIPKEDRAIKIWTSKTQWYICDAYTKSTNTINEFNGDFWHGNPKIYNLEKINPVNGIQYKILYEKTLEKIKNLEAAGYNVVSIWESDFNKQVEDSKFMSKKIKIENINNENLEVDISKLTFNRIDSIKKVNYIGKVYDLEVDTTLSYGTKDLIAHNGGGKRRGSAAIYIEPHHADILEFLDLRKNNGKEEVRARDLNLALWASDLFFKRVEADKDWTLMDPNKCKGLSDVYGVDFENLYEQYESQGLGERTVKARDVWKAIIESQIETGQPYVLAKDACNKYSNQKNLGTIKSSNLCLDGSSVVKIKKIDKISGQSDGPYFTTLEDLHNDFVKKGHHYSYEVLGWDFNSNDLKKSEHFKKIKNVMFNGSKDVIKVKSSNTTHAVFTTADHMIYTTRNSLWKEAKDVSFFDDFRISNDANFEVYSPRNNLDFKSNVDVYDIEIDLSNEDKIDKTTEYNQRNFFANGIIVHNCAEIIEYSSPEETAVCNLASVSLPSCVEGKKGKRIFNYHKLFNIVKTMTENLNKIIDTEYYPVETAKNSNLKHRPIGIGIQGLADVFAMMRYSWESEEAKLLNIQIMETIYYAALDSSSDLAKKYESYSSYEGSDLNKGILHFDHYGYTPTDLWDWKKLRAKIKKNGIRNSLLIALMPTASTSQILGNTESFEMITSNIYKRSTLSGDFIMLNKHLVSDLIDLGLWNDKLKQKIIANQGSVQNIKEIPDDIKNLYKTCWETSQKIIIDMAADRQMFIDQSQSMNLYFSNPNSAKITSALFHGWKKGLKTLVYYMRSNSSIEAKQFTIDQSILKEEEEVVDETLEEGLVCSLDNPENCEMCSG